MSQWICAGTPHSPDIQPAKPMNYEGFPADWNRNEWQPVDFREFLATTVDLRIVLLQGEVLSIPAS